MDILFSNGRISNNAIGVNIQSEDIGEDVAEDIGEDVAEDIGEDVAEDIGEDVAEDIGAVGAVGQLDGFASVAITENNQNMSFELIDIPSFNLFAF